MQLSSANRRASVSISCLVGTVETSAAANSDFAALASSVGVSFVNDGGGIGKALKDMSSSQNVKGVLTAMATAGVLKDVSTNAVKCNVAKNLSSTAAVRLS